VRRVHLVGTLGQPDVPTGMALAAQRVGQYLETIPDGEPDDPNWVVDTIERMAGRPEVKTLVPPRFYKDPLKPWHGAVYTARRGMKITPETFGLAYAQHAAAALPMLRDINHAAGYFLRLQVDIPGPPDLTAFSFGPLWSRYYDTVVEALSLQVKAIEEMAGTRPVYQLSIPVETYLVARAPARLREFVATKLARRLAGFVATTLPGTEWILHLCVGDPHGKPLITLQNPAPLVDLANALVQAWPAGYRLNAVHLPLGDGQTPVGANPWFMAPLYGLELPEDVHLSAGLAHLGQDLETQKVALAEAERAARRPLGVSTPCGLGRRPAQAVELLDRMAALAQSP
jgi:hypothetical protein